jgi:hypothetical protein
VADDQGSISSQILNTAAAPPISWKSTYGVFAKLAAIYCFGRPGQRPPPHPSPTCAAITTPARAAQISERPAGDLLDHHAGRRNGEAPAMDEVVSIAARAGVVIAADAEN